MAYQSLKKLRRVDLLEMLIAQVEENERLLERVDQLQFQLEKIQFQGARQGVGESPESTLGSSDQRAVSREIPAISLESVRSPRGIGRNLGSFEVPSLSTSPRTPFLPVSPDSASPYSNPSRNQNSKDYPEKNYAPRLSDEPQRERLNREDDLFEQKRVYRTQQGGAAQPYQQSWDRQNQENPRNARSISGVEEVRQSHRSPELGWSQERPAEPSLNPHERGRVSQRLDNLTEANPLREPPYFSTRTNQRKPLSQRLQRESLPVVDKKELPYFVLSSEGEE